MQNLLYEANEVGAELSPAGVGKACLKLRRYVRGEILLFLIPGALVCSTICGLERQ